MGYNYRLPGLNASLGISQLKKIKKYLRIKNKIYNHYKKYFSGNEIFLMKNRKISKITIGLIPYLLKTLI